MKTVFLLILFSTHLFAGERDTHGFRANSVDPKMKMKSDNDKERIRIILKNHSTQYVSCFKKESESNKAGTNSKVRVIFKFTINSTGKVINPEIESDEISSDSIKDCLKNALSEIQFGTFTEGKTLTIRQPFNVYKKN